MTASAIETYLRAPNQVFASSSEELDQFALEQLSSRPDLLSCDVPRTRAEFPKHVTQITMHPVQQNGDRHYSCKGEWNLLGELTAPGDLWMVAGAPATI